MTATKEELLALAERVEGLDGPDREVELDIWRIFDPKSPDIEAMGKIPLPWLHNTTSSFDAAMTLVPKDECWRVGHDADDPSGFMAQCSYTRSTAIMGFVVAYGPTPALALTAAALRAQAELVV